MSAMNYQQTLLARFFANSVRNSSGLSYLDKSPNFTALITTAEQLAANREHRLATVKRTRVEARPSQTRSVPTSSGAQARSVHLSGQPRKPGTLPERNQARTHSSWKTCRQFNSRTRSPSEYAIMQMEQVSLEVPGSWQRSGQSAALISAPYEKHVCVRASRRASSRATRSAASRASQLCQAFTTDGPERHASTPFITAASTERAKQTCCVSSAGGGARAICIRCPSARKRDVEGKATACHRAR